VGLKKRAGACRASLEELSISLLESHAIAPSALDQQRFATDKHSNPAEMHPHLHTKDNTGALNHFLFLLPPRPLFCVGL